MRLAWLLGLTKNRDAQKIEQDIMKIVPKKDWWAFSNALIWHGRRVCIARRPKCGECMLNRLCPSSLV
jgi:endonuclease-3